MAGEHILVIDDSAAVRDLARRSLENRGFKATTAGNAAAALLAPEFDDYALILLDADLEGLDGLTASRELKADTEKCRAPIVLLVPDDADTQSRSVDLGAADGYLLKPFTPDALASKVQATLDTFRMREKVNQMLAEIAENHIRDFARQHIQEAVDRERENIAEAAVRSVVDYVESIATSEIERKVIALSAEKEEELIHKTLAEISQAAVEDLARKQVRQALDELLRETTDKAVTGAISRILPTLVRERVKEITENSLPREINIRIQKATADLAPSLSQQLMEMVTGITEKVVPKVAREKMPDVLEKNVTMAANRLIPTLFNQQAPKIVENLMNRNVDSLIRSTAAGIRRQVRVLIFIMLLIFLLLSSAMGYMLWQIYNGQMPLQRTNQPSAQTQTEPEPTLAQARFGAG